MKSYYFLPVILFLLCYPSLGKSQDVKENKNDLSIQLEKLDASSDNANDGVIKIKISEGIAPYRIYCFSPYSPPSEHIGSDLKLSNLKSGDYLFVIRDSSGATITKEITILSKR